MMNGRLLINERSHPHITKLPNPHFSTTTTHGYHHEKGR